MLILASNSERRKKLLTDIGVEFISVTNKVNEKVDKKLKPNEIVMILSKRKADAALETHPEDTIIAADTIVYFEGEVLGKPKNNEDAFEMLKKLRGNKHSVYTGVTILNKHKEKTFYSKADVYMNNYNDLNIYEYIQTKEPKGKAGAYAIQGEGGKLVEKYTGDFFTIVGLPVKQIKKVLKEFTY